MNIESVSRFEKQKESEKTKFLISKIGLTIYKIMLAFNL